MAKESLIPAKPNFCAGTWQALAKASTASRVSTPRFFKQKRMKGKSWSELSASSSKGSSSTTKSSGKLFKDPPMGVSSRLANAEMPQSTSSAMPRMLPQSMWRNPCDALVAPALNQSCSNGIRRYCTGDNVQMTGSMCAKIHRLKGWWKGTSGCLDTSMLSDTHPRSPSSPPGSRPILAADSLVTSKQLMGGSPPRPSQARSWFQQEFHLQDDSNPVRHSCVQIFTKIHHLPLCCWFLFLFYNVATGLVMLLIKVIVFQRTLLPRALRVHGSTHGRQESSHKMLWMFSDCVQLKLFCEEDAGDSAVDCNRRSCLLCLLDLEKLPSIQTIKTSSGQWRNAFAITQGTHL